MADGLTTQTTVATIPSGSTIATDDAGAAGHVQVVSGGVSALVFVLNVARYPATVARLIVSVVVLAVNAVLVGWPLANVSKESLEAIEPFLTHPDTASAVVFPSSVVGIRATLPRRSPHVVFGHRPTTSLQADSLSEPFNSEAAATDGLSCLKIDAPDRLSVAAVAHARPLTAVPSTTRRGDVSIQNRQSAESVAAQVLDEFHPPILAVLRGI